MFNLTMGSFISGVGGSLIKYGIQLHFKYGMKYGNKYGNKYRMKYGNQLHFPKATKEFKALTADVGKRKERNDLL